MQYIFAFNGDRDWALAITISDEIHLNESFIDFIQRQTLQFKVVKYSTE